MYLKIDVREEDKKRSETTQHRVQFSPEKKGVSLSIFSHFPLLGTILPLGGKTQNK